MSKRHVPKHKIDRRLNVNLWGRPKSPVNRRPYGPGEHGQRRRKPSDYGLQLAAKQKLRGYYGNIGEKQFFKYYEEAVRRKGDTSQTLIELLERRLDAAVYRLKFVPTVFAARQFVNHCHVLVNGKRVNVPSYQLNDGDVIQVRERARKIPMVDEAMNLAERDVPEYFRWEPAEYKGTFLRAPSLDEVPYPTKMEPNLVIEFYSR